MSGTCGISPCCRGCVEPGPSDCFVWDWGCPPHAPKGHFTVGQGNALVTPPPPVSRALKGRFKRGILLSLTCPFRARRLDRRGSQGVALGYGEPAPLGRVVARRDLLSDAPGFVETVLGNCPMPRSTVIPPRWGENVGVQSDANLAFRNEMKYK